MKALELLNSGSSKLQKQKIKTHRLDSEILLSKVLNISREQTLVRLNQHMKITEVFAFDNLIQRRLHKEPVAYIINEKEFWSKKFKVNKNTLIPRPETELLIENLIDIYKNKKISFLDVGTGTGCIIISLLSELTNSNGVGIDISSSALKIAASFQKTIIEILNKKTKIAFLEFEKQNNLKKKIFVVAGGVAANKKIRSMLINLCKEKNYESIFPPIELCGDNAAMIGMVGLEKFKLNQFNDLDYPAKPRWPLDEKANFLKGAGVKL